jgi:hypothetical protein
VTARRAFTLVTGAGLAAYGAHVAFGFGGEGSESFFQDWVYNALVLAAALSCLVRGLVSRAERARWLSLGGGLLCLFGGELYYTLHLSRLAAPPYPSLADGLYLAFYPAGFAALVLFAPRASRQLRASLWLDGLMSALGVAALTAALLLQPIVSSTGGDRLAVATTLAYPLGDVTLLAFVVGLLALNAWKPSRASTLIAAGLATMAVADGIFLWQSANGTYAEGAALDALWPAAALLLGHAAWQPSVREATRLEGMRLLVASTRAARWWSCPTTRSRSCPTPTRRCRGGGRRRCGCWASRGRTSRARASSTCRSRRRPTPRGPSSASSTRGPSASA